MVRVEVFSGFLDFGRLSTSIHSTGFSSFTSSTFFNGVTYGNNTFVQVGHHYIRELCIFRSGIVNSLSRNYRDCYEDNQYATTWNGSSSDSYFHSGKLLDISLQDVAFGNNRFVSVSGRTMVYSTDGKNWYGSPDSLGDTSGNTTVYLSTIAFGNDTFLAMGSYGRIVTTSDGSSPTITYIQSLDGVTVYGVTYSE